MSQLDHFSTPSNGVDRMKIVEGTVIRPHFRLLRGPKPRIVTASFRMASRVALRSRQPIDGLLVSDNELRGIHTGSELERLDLSAVGHSERIEPSLGPRS